MDILNSTYLKTMPNVVTAYVPAHVVDVLEAFGYLIFTWQISDTCGDRTVKRLLPKGTRIFVKPYENHIPRGR